MVALPGSTDSETWPQIRLLPRCLQAIPDKALRGKFHQTLREAFSSKLVSAHKEGEAGEAPAIEVSWAQAGAAGRNRKRGGAGSKGERGEPHVLRTRVENLPGERPRPSC